METKIKNIYFIGIGGIGMSALARFYNHAGANIAGYDKTATPLTEQLEKEGMNIHYNDDIKLIDSSFLDKENTLVIYTPAIPKDHTEYNYFVANDFNIVKRSQALGAIGGDKRLIAVAGTHGKTSISTLITYLCSEALKLEDGSIGGASALIGGIMKNFNSNLHLGAGTTLVVEADEFDRSFLQLYPSIAIVSSIDADHLDIYGDHDHLKESFAAFVAQIKSSGTFICKRGVDLKSCDDSVTQYEYSLNNPQSDFYAKNISLGSDGLYSYDIVTPSSTIEGCKLGIPALVNVENSVAAVAALTLAGCDEHKLRQAIGNFKGVKRRFELYVNNPHKVYIDDYAHHPEELRATIDSIKAIYPGKSITAIFQPHLYSRTRDFADGFSKSLSLCDKVILLPIYPARELPIEGVGSYMLLPSIESAYKGVVEKSALLDILKEDDSDILVTFGAGDIDKMCEDIAKLYRE